MSLCILAGGKTVTLAAAAFTLAWTHSVEKISWQEDWIVAPDGLRIAEARVQGSGAGMEPPEGSVFRDGWWVYAPKLGTLPRLVLAASGATGEGWTLCADTGCMELGATAGEPVTLEPCGSDH